MKTRRAVAGALLATAFAAGASRAQEGSPPSTEPQPEARRVAMIAPDVRFYDSVVALVGDRAILASTIDQMLTAYLVAERTTFETKLALEQPPDRPLAAAEVERRWQRHMPPEQREALWVQFLKQKIEEAHIAESAKTLGNAPPEQVQRQIDAYLEDYMNRETAQFGGVNEYTTQLNMLGKSWKSVEEEQRLKYMRSMALWLGVNRRLHEQHTLFVTPKEMRRYYDEHRAEFVVPAAADVAMLAFAIETPSPDGEPEPEAIAAARDRASAAAAAWRGRDATLDVVRSAHGGSGQVIQVLDSPQDPRRGFIKEFATKAAEGEVSEPLRQGGSFLVLKLVTRRSGRNDAFDDPAVQERILEKLKDREEGELRQRFLQRQRPTVQRFPVPLPRG